MKAMDLKKMLGVIMIFIVVMFALMLTTSYAWYSFSNASTRFDVATSNEEVTVTYYTGKYINTSVAVPISSNEIKKYSEKSRFSIEVNNKDLDDGVAISVDLVDVTIDDALKNSNFKYELLLNDKSIASGDFSEASTGSDFNISDYVVLNSIDDNDFELRIYILDNGNDQSSMMNKTFRGTISINVISRIKLDIDKLGADIIIRNVSIDGKNVDYIPTNGYYDMSASCTKGSTLSWEPLSKTITYEGGSPSGDVCSLTFTTSDSPDYPLLSEMPVGSYVKYKGRGGYVGDKSVSCQIGGPASSSTETAETEAPNSCLGQNAREDLDFSGYTYGYCNDDYYKFLGTGWRIAYKDEDEAGNQNAVLVSAGSPECNAMVRSSGNLEYIKLANTKALKYCNSEFVDGDCSCADNDKDGYCDCTDSDNDGLCDELSDDNWDAWAINDYDFYNMTKSITGIGKRLYSGSSNLGEAGGSLGAKLYCGEVAGYYECGYNNTLIDNGGYYWFAARYSITGDGNVSWMPWTRYIHMYSYTAAYGLRPVISLSSSVYVVSGSGTLEDPYVIEN